MNVAIVSYKSYALNFVSLQFLFYRNYYPTVLFQLSTVHDVKSISLNFRPYNLEFDMHDFCTVSM